MPFTSGKAPWHTSPTDSSIGSHRASRLASLRVGRIRGIQTLSSETTEARQAGYDATNEVANRKYQMKDRCVLAGSKPAQRIGKIDTTKEFDAVLLVLPDKAFEATEN